jgi:hypothetical protein
LIVSDRVLPLSKVWFSLFENLILSWLLRLGGTGGDMIILLDPSAIFEILDVLVDTCSLTVDSGKDSPLSSCKRKPIVSAMGMPIFSTIGVAIDKPIGDSCGHRRRDKARLPEELGGAIGGSLYGGGSRMQDIGSTRSGVNIGEL